MSVPTPNPFPTPAPVGVMPTDFLTALNELITAQVVSSLQSGPVYDQVVTIAKQAVGGGGTPLPQPLPGGTPTDADRTANWPHIVAMATALGFRFPADWHNLTADLLPV